MFAALIEDGLCVAVTQRETGYRIRSQARDELHKVHMLYYGRLAARRYLGFKPV